MTDRRPVIIDTDPGKDDAVAILLALAARDRLDIRAFTVGAGNVPLALTARNARALVELAGCGDIPVHAGCEAPLLLRELATAEHLHGTSGLDGAALPQPTIPLAKPHAVDAIIDILEAAPDRAITLCALGPLTNIATALERAPSIRRKVREIVLMGGAIALGNVTPSAEFNIYVDPHAAEVVLGSRVPVIMIPLEATHQALATPEWVRHIAGLGTSAGRAIGGMFIETGERRSKRHGGHPGVPLHDPCVIAFLLWPELFSGTMCHVAVETDSPLTRGRTAIDRWRATGRAPNALVIERLDRVALFARLTERLAALP